MSAIHDLIAQVSDQRLRERLAAEWASASKEKKFGLVFEDHLPELLPLYTATPRRGDGIDPRRAGAERVGVKGNGTMGQVNVTISGTSCPDLICASSGASTSSISWASPLITVSRAEIDPL